MDIDKFGEIMDKFLTDAHVQMILESPEGTQEVTIEDNMGIGGTGQFFFLLKGIGVALRNMAAIVGELDVEKFVDALWDTCLRDELIEKMQEAAKED